MCSLYFIYCHKLVYDELYHSWRVILLWTFHGCFPTVTDKNQIFHQPLAAEGVTYVAGKRQAQMVLLLARISLKAPAISQSLSNDNFPDGSMQRTIWHVRFTSMWGPSLLKTTHCLRFGWCATFYDGGFSQLCVNLKSKVYVYISDNCFRAIVLCLMLFGACSPLCD